LAKASDGKVVLFFNAKWCSTCKQIDKDLKTAKIPDNLTILSVDYDKNIAMRKKYQVPFENSYVQVDQNGTIVNSWSGSEDLAEIVALAK
jgi:thiol-disulfide isomerase/thioredoxin